ncbi:MAG: hypothetical protein B6D55_06195 [Candidatus Omnitrophica bacterium 4484_70.2]|nr:MAG: hypothetical protein B6D55_06195 [Candidatus Omnitrophica bacterium 4484_70.2]
MIIVKKMIRLKQQLEELAQKIKNADASSLIPSNAKINNVRIVEHAVLPSQPVRPKKFLNIVLSIFVGLVGGVMLAFFFEYTDNTFRVAQDIEKELNVKFLGYVPRNGFKTPTSLWIRNFNLTDPFLVKKFPQSLVSNSLRLIKRRLKDAIDSTNSRIIMFSPIEPYKTFYSTITNLSAVFSEESKVLIIDTDIRSQKFRNILKMNPQATLQKYLEGKCSLSEIVYTFQDIPNLSIIFSKDKDSSQLESIDISKIRELLYKVSSRFDYIFICSAPLGIFEEGYALAEIVDKIVFVIEYASTKKSYVRDLNC